MSKVANNNRQIYAEVFSGVRKAADANLKMQSDILHGWSQLWPTLFKPQEAWLGPVWRIQEQWANGVLGLAKNQWDTVDRQLDTMMDSLAPTPAVTAKPKESAASRPRISVKPSEKIEKATPVQPPEASATDQPHVSGTKNIAQKVAVVTGAASGIGESVSRELANRGARAVMMVDLSDRVRESTDRINESLGRNAVEAMVGDTTDPAFRAQVFDTAAEKYGTVTICVPAAGITRDALCVRLDKETGKSIVYPVDDFRAVTEVNLIAPIYWAIEMVGRIAEDRRGRGLKRWEPEEGVEGAVVFLGSVSSQGNKGQISYAVAKAGLEGAAATMMKEAIFHGVRCGIIHPGFTDTPMARALGEDYLQKNVLPYTQLRRLIRPEEIADAICFMISNSAVSGELWADAGWHPPA